MEKIELDFGAISIDNSSFKKDGYRFDEGLLAQMQQFKDSPVKVLQTDIVHNEALKHIANEIVKTKESIFKALRSANKQLKVCDDDINNAKKILLVDVNPNEVAEARLVEYYELIGAEIIFSKTYSDISCLMDMYFSTRAPFESGKDKKNEFPDAIALLALEGWAEKYETNLIIVSEDKGWKNYAETSERITLISSLSEALEKFQPHNRVSSIVGAIRQGSFYVQNRQVSNEIDHAVELAIDRYDVSIEAVCTMLFEWSDVETQDVSHNLDIDDDGLVKVRIVRVDDESIVLKVVARVEVEVSANFDFYVKDPIDMDYVSMGSNTYSTAEVYKTDLLLTFIGDFSEDLKQLPLPEIEVLGGLSRANFGEIAPDWGDEDEEQDDILESAFEA